MKRNITILAMLLSVSIFSQSELTSYLFGGANNEYSYEHCFDADNNYIIVGVVRGTDIYYDNLIGTLDPTKKNIFIRKYTADLTTLISSTIICGSGHDYCKSVAIDSQGNVFIGAFTLSSDVPTTSSVYQQTNNSPGNYDGYIIKLNSNLDQLLAATYYGGEDEDKILKMRIDQDDNVVFVGNTISTNNIASIGAFDEDYNGTTGSLFDFGDGFIVKLDNNLENRLAGTYIGGTGDEACYSVLVNNENNIVITGQTTSPDYPTTANAYQTTNNGGFDMIITEFTSDLTQVLNSTLIGANGMDTGWDISYNEVNNRYVIGAQTFSTNFNITGSVADTTYGGSGDGMLVVLNGDMESIHSATFVGGSAQDLITTVACTSNVIAYAGITESSGLPTSSDAYYPNYLDENSFADGLYGTINNDLSAFNHLSYFGGNDDDHIWDISIFNDNLYVNGTTYSTNVESVDSFQGASDAILGIVENIYLKVEQDTLISSYFSVYPNPSNNYIIVENHIDTAKNILITDVTGKLVKEVKFHRKTTQININDIEAGLYFVRIGQQTQRIIIE